MAECAGCPSNMTFAPLCVFTHGLTQDLLWSCTLRTIGSKCNIYMLHWLRTHAWSHCVALIEATGHGSLGLVTKHGHNSQSTHTGTSCQQHGRKVIAGNGSSSSYDDLPVKMLCSDRIIAPTASVTTQVQIRAHQGSS